MLAAPTLLMSRMAPHNLAAVMLLLPATWAWDQCYFPDVGFFAIDGNTLAELEADADGTG